MASSCDSYFQGLVARLTKLDSCGVPVAGATSTVVSNGFVSVEFEADETDGEEITQILADGTRCYYRKTKKNLNGYTVSIEFCKVDPELFNLATSATLVTDDAGSPVAQGFAVDDSTYASANFALEVWTNLDPGACPTGRRWGYVLFPWLTNASVGTPTIENGSANFMVNEAFTRSGNGWGTGPYHMQYNQASAPVGLFSSLASTAHLLVYKTNMAPPTPTCGYQTLVLPT